MREASKEDEYSLSRGRFFPHRMYNVRNKQMSYNDLVLHPNNQGSSSIGWHSKPVRDVSYCNPRSLRMNELADVPDDYMGSWFDLRRAPRDLALALRLS